MIVDMQKCKGYGYVTFAHT